MDISTISDCLLERYITNIMSGVGVPAHLKGYYYIRDAILLCIRDMEAVTMVTKLLYPTVAKHFSTSTPMIERGIRTAIEASWERGDTDTFEEIFGYSIKSGRQRPTNSEYIARIADKIRMDIKAM